MQRGLSTRFKNLFNFLGSKKNVEPPSFVNAYGRMAARDRFDDIGKYITKKNAVIVDGGANNGVMTDKFLEMFPQAIIYSFEPQPILVEKLKKKFINNKNINIFSCALGATNTILKFNILKYENSSSLLKPSETNFKYHNEKMNTTQEIDVDVKRLDQIIQESEIDILKLDLQGYELEALKGSKGILDRIKVITTEIEFVPLYEGQPLFGDIDVFLRANGFSLLNLYELYTQPDGQLTAGDAVYINDRFF